MNYYALPKLLFKRTGDKMSAFHKLICCHFKLHCFFFYFVLFEISFSCNNMSLMQQTYGCLGQHVIDKFFTLMIYYVHQWPTLVLPMKPVFSTLLIWERPAVHKWIHGLFYPVEPSMEPRISFWFMSGLAPSVCSVTCRYAIPNWIALKYLSGAQGAGEY